MRKLKRLAGTLVAVLSAMAAFSQPTFPENGVADPRHGHFAFTHAILVKDASTTLKDATLVIKDGRIVAVGAGLPVPAGAVEIDCSGKFIYPSFIDIYTDYGTPQRQPQAGGGQFNFFAQQQFDNAVKGPYGWNQAIKSDVDVYKIFGVNVSTAKTNPETGFCSLFTPL